MPFHAYDVAIQLIRALKPVLDQIKKHDRDLARQGRKAATSIPQNIAESNYRLGRDRLYHFSVAAGSAGEIQAVLDVAEAWGYLSSEELQEARVLLDREQQLLGGFFHPKSNRKRKK